MKEAESWKECYTKGAIGSAAAKGAANTWVDVSPWVTHD
jgi:hypothetical protein